ncbi:MAG: SPOR domain-containing protein, partial [Burkholderiaceae bacterium]|nr:SPOR domain-containing protein [Burkholderiaceae bacterium]
FAVVTTPGSPDAAATAAAPSGAAAMPPALSVAAAQKDAAAAAAAGGQPARLNVETVYAASEAPRERAGAAAIAATPAARPTSSAGGSPGAAQRGFWLQFGAFNSLENARSAMTHLARRLDFLGAAFDVRQDGALYKVQAGPWARREEAAAAAGRVRALTDLRPFATLR